MTGFAQDEELASRRALLGVTFWSSSLRYSFMVLLRREDVYQIDQRVLASGIGLTDLIEQVGEALAHWFVQSLSSEKPVFIACGPGNNGNDGLALAQQLADRGWAVQVYLCHPEKNQSTLIEKAKKLIVDELPDLNGKILVDALFGIGLDRSPEGIYREIIENMNQAQSQRIALDISSGVDCNSGQVYDPAFKADHTLSVSVAKVGQYLLPGNEYCGQINLVPVKILDEVANKSQWLGASLELDPSWPQTVQPKKSSHKYNRGKVSLVLCQKFPGAALLAAQACQNAGAGYVQIFCPEDMLTDCQIGYPQFVWQSYSDEDQLVETLAEEESQVFILGPGWSLENFAVDKLLRLNKTLVLDGGLLSRELAESLKNGHQAQIILTPHGGELKRLVGDSASKWTAVEQLTKGSQAVVVGKGYDTLIAQKEKSFRITTWNSPALAGAGSGDILAGIIGALAAQGLEPFAAACYGVYIHRELAKDQRSAPPEFLLDQLLKF